MTNLDEAIKHCEEVAYRNELLMKRYDDASGYNRSHNEKIRTDGAKNCERLVSLYRKIAEWLRELKAYRDDRDDCDYETLKIKLENAEDVIRGLQEDLRDAREELRWR